MTATSEPGVLVARRPYPDVVGPRGNLLYRMITTTDHKLIGIMYCVACFVFFFVAGLMALLIRAELAAPGLQFLSNEQYNQLFTMHGTAMLLFYATPIVFGFANLVLPLQIGAPDVAFPRLNALSLWLFVFGALIALSGFVFNIVSSIGPAILGVSVLPFIWNVFKTWRFGEIVVVDDPWGHGNSLEWATSCPPPRHNFLELPNIRSERPAFELHYPHMRERMRAEAHIGRRPKLGESPESVHTFGPRTEADR